MYNPVGGYRFYDKVLIVSPLAEIRSLSIMLEMSLRDGLGER